MAELADAVDALEAWQGAFLVIQGDENHFCAGADLSLVTLEFADLENAAAMSEIMTCALNKVRSAPHASIALIEGAAIGGGAEIATACDFRILSNTARLEFRQAFFGVSPGWGGAGRLVEIVGAQKGLEILTRAAKVSPMDWLEVGLADAVFEEQTAEAFVAAWIAKSDHVPTAGIRASKKAIRASVNEGLGGSGERAAFLEAWADPERGGRMGQRPSGKG